MGAGFGPLAFATLGFELQVRGHGLDIRGIAVQGIGFTPRLVGLQGLCLDERKVEPEPIHHVPRRKKRRDTDDDVLLFIL